MDAPRAELASASFLMLGNSLPSCSPLFIIIYSVEIGFATDKNIIIYSKNASNIEKNSNDITEEPNEEDNWKLELVFYDSSVENGKTPLTEINWDASNGGYGTGETRVITVQLNYEIENTETFNKGDIKISIPNLIYKSSENNENSPLWNASVLLGANDATHSGYEFTFTAGDFADTTQEYYTFINEIVLEPSIHKGSIQIVYNITPMKKEIWEDAYKNGIKRYEDESNHIYDKNLISTVNDSIQTEPISFHYQRKYIHPWKEVPYEIVTNTEKISSYDGLSNNPDDYIWVRYTYLISEEENSLAYPNIHAKDIYIDTTFPEECIIYSGTELLNDNNIYEKISFNLGGGIINGKYINTLRNSPVKKSYIVGFPKSIYTENNLSIDNIVKLYGTYKQDEIMLAESFSKINLEEFYFDYGDGSGRFGATLWKYMNNRNNKHMTCQKIQNNQAGNTVDWRIAFTALYRGYPMTIKVADDLILASNMDGDVEIINDDYYCFNSIAYYKDCFKNGNGSVIEPNKYDCELYVRYANEKDYVLYDSFKNPSKDLFWSFEKSSQKVVGWYFLFYDVTESVNFDYAYNENRNDYLAGNFGTITKFFKTDIPNSGSFYNATYVNVWDKINGELILQSESSEDLYQGITGKMIMEYDLENHQHYLTRGLGEDGWSYVTIKQVIQSLVAKQNFKTVTQDNSNERFLNSCEMIAHLDLGNTNWYNADPLYREQYLREYMLKGWKTYTLLPVGIELLSTEQEIEDSLNAFGQEYHRLYDYDWNFISAGNAEPGNHMDIVQNAIDSDVKITKNWKNTGRTRIEIESRLNKQFWFSTYYYNCYYDFSYTYNFAVPYESYLEFGSTYTGYTYVDKLDEQKFGYNIGSSVKDNGTKDSDAVDIDEDGRIDDYLSFGQSSFTINAIFSTYQNISMKAKTDLSNYDTGVINSSYNSEYTYRLGITTGSNNITNAIFYDNLEEAYGKQGYWKGEFIGIDTSYAEAKGFTVKTYYSENADTGKLYDEPHHLNPEYMEYTETVDKSIIKSLAFEFFDSEGNPAIIPSSTLMYVLINMKAPNDESINTLAYNRFHTEWNTVDSLGFVSEEKVELTSNIVKIALPNSLKSFGSYVLKHEYYVRDIHGNIMLEDTIQEEAVEDIFEGIEINTSDLEHKYESNEKTYQLLEEDSVIIEADIINYLTIKYVRDEFIFKIEWNDSSPELRPETYQISLKKDGTVVETKENPSDEGTCSFPNYHKYDENGIEHTYIFEANIGDRYELIYDKDRDIYIAILKESSFSVKIPKKITLDGNTGSANYQINVNGILYYNDTLTVKPEESFVMKDRNNISEIQSNVSQDRTCFKKETLGATNGKIQIAQDLFSGYWMGTMHFEISFIKQN